MRESISRFRVKKSRILNWKYQYDLLRYIFVKNISVSVHCKLTETMTNPVIITFSSTQIVKFSAEMKQNTEEK